MTRISGRRLKVRFLPRALMKPEILKWSLSVFDISKLRSACNVNGCSNVPQKGFSVFEYVLNKRTDLVTVYLCPEHSKEINNYLKSLRQLAPNMILEKRVRNL